MKYSLMNSQEKTMIPLLVIAIMIIIFSVLIILLIPIRIVIIRPGIGLLLQILTRFIAMRKSSENIGKAAECKVVYGI